VAPRSEDPKLIIRAINFVLVQPMSLQYSNVTDGQTDGRTTYDSNSALALRASRGNKWTVQYDITNVRCRIGHWRAFIRFLRFVLCYIYSLKMLVKGVSGIVVRVLDS